MKFLFALCLTLTTASVLRFRDDDPAATAYRIMASLHQPVRMSLAPLMRQTKPGLTFDNCTAEIGCSQEDVQRLCSGATGPLGGGDDMATESRQEGPAPPEGFPECPEDAMCACIPLIPQSSCEDSTACSEGESCVTAPIFERLNLCMSNCAIVAALERGEVSMLEVVDGPNPTRPLECRGLVSPPSPTKEPPTAQGKITPEPLTPTSTPDEEDATTPEPTLEPFITPEVEPTTTPDGVQPVTQPEEEVDDGICFPGSAIVHLANGKTLTIEQLQAGHEVLHDTIGTSSKIFLFTHRTKEYQGWFYQLTTKSGYSITMTGNHYIYADGQLTTADSVKRGEKLRTVSGDSPVTRIRRVRGHGLYAPHSLHGDLVVDGIVVSGYSRAVNPTLAHALLAPVRWFVTKTGIVEPLGGLFYNGGRGVEKIMIKGADRY